VARKDYRSIGGRGEFFAESLEQLCEYAREEFRLSASGADGTSLRETLLTVERMTGTMPDEGINHAEFPDHIGYLWGWFLSLNASRGGGMGPSPITYLEMQAYFSLMRITPSPFDIDALRRLDSIALQSATTKAKQ
jgi:hypothetical protein